MIRAWMIAGLVAVVLVPAGCGDDSCVDCPPAEGPYLPQTSPENVVANLAAAYRFRDIDGYAALLAPEFIFRFQPADAQQIGTEFWTREEDIAATRALFEATVVHAILIDLVHGPAVPPDSSAGFPDGTRQIRILQTHLEVDQTDGVTWSIRDPQDMFFRRGDQGLGENPEHWYLIEWRDIPTPAKPAGAPPLAASEFATWGKLKAHYLDSSSALTPPAPSP